MWKIDIFPIIGTAHPERSIFRWVVKWSDDVWVQGIGTEFILEYFVRCADFEPSLYFYETRQHSSRMHTEVASTPVERYIPPVYPHTLRQVQWAMDILPPPPRPPWDQGPGRDLAPEIPHPVVDRMAETCENITFPQLRWRLLKMARPRVILLNLYIKFLSCTHNAHDVRFR